RRPIRYSDCADEPGRDPGRGDRRRGAHPSSAGTGLLPDGPGDPRSGDGSSAGGAGGPAPHRARRGAYRGGRGWPSRDRGRRSRDRGRERAMTTPSQLVPQQPPTWLQRIIDAPHPERAAKSLWASKPVTPVIGTRRDHRDRPHAEVTFVYQEPRTDVDVLIHLNGITDAHREDVRPALLQHVPGSDLWHGTYLLPSDGTWGYRFVAQPEIRHDVGRTREGWLQVHRAGQVDPHNPRRQPHALGTSSSVLVMPQAYQHPCWSDVPQQERPDATWQFTDPDGQPRTVHYSRIGSAPCRVLVCFDGERWADLGLAAALRRAGLDLELILIDSHGAQRRAEDLPRPERAARLLQAALERRAHVGGDPIGPEQVVVAGQSF